MKPRTASDAWVDCVLRMTIHHPGLQAVLLDVRYSIVMYSMFCQNMTLPSVPTPEFKLTFLGNKLLALRNLP